MVKAPRAGQAKTRLVPHLSEAEAASLAACFAQDALGKARAQARRVIVAYTPADGRRILSPLLDAPRLIWIEQLGADFGARLESSAAHAAAQNFSPLIIIGTDSPTLPPAFIEMAIRALTRGPADITLGPTEDGGYYLLGLRTEAPHELLRGISWGTPLVYQQTAASAARLGLRLLPLPPWYDVDTPADLARLRHEILTDKKAQRRAPATHRWLLTHDPRALPSA